MTVSKNAPNAQPIQLQRIIRKTTIKPEVKLETLEPYVSDVDYENINNIISMCGTTMEKTARTYFANTEEELRNHLLAALNTHYEAATEKHFAKLVKQIFILNLKISLLLLENVKYSMVNDCFKWQYNKLLIIRRGKMLKYQ